MQLTSRGGSVLLYLGDMAAGSLNWFPLPRTPPSCSLVSSIKNSGVGREVFFWLFGVSLGFLSILAWECGDPKIHRLTDTVSSFDVSLA